MDAFMAQVISSIYPYHVASWVVLLMVDGVSVYDSGFSQN